MLKSNKLKHNIYIYIYIYIYIGNYHNPIHHIQRYKVIPELKAFIL